MTLPSRKFLKKLLVSLFVAQGFVLGSGLPGLCQAPPSKGAVKALRLVQESSVDGKYELLLSPLGLRIKNFKAGYELYSAAPDWQIYAVRAEAKEIARMPLGQFRKFTMPSFRMMGDAASLGKPLKTIQTADSKGKKTFYQFPGPGKVETGYSGWIDRVEVLNYELIARDGRDVILPAELSAIVFRFYNLPNFSGVPTEMYSVIKEGKSTRRGWLLRTESSKVELVNNGNVFRLPAGKFKDAGLINSQYLTRGISGLADDMSELIDVKRK